MAPPPNSSDRPVQRIVLPKQQTHLFLPPPLVVDLDGGLVNGWRGGGATDRTDPVALTMSRPGWELIHLHRRFRSRILLLSAMPEEWSVWIAELIGLTAGSVISLPQSEGARGKSALILRHFERRGFDFLGGPGSVEAVGAHARKLWLLGLSIDIRNRMLTSGVPLVMLDARDNFPLRRLVPVARAAPDWLADVRRDLPDGVDRRKNTA